uniref:Glycosyltransferase n=1 Tax=Leersia perrieri TaxID=77586 RepID=A0A0D9VYE9_9ORYZ
MRATTPAPARRDADADAPTLRLVFLPFLSRSHFGPVAAKAAAAAAAADASAAATATIVTTPHFAALAPPNVAVHVAPFHFPGGHEDFSLLPSDVSPAAFFAAAEAALAPALADAVRGSSSAAAVVAVVSDAVLHWAPRVARECGVPHVTFHTIGAFAASAMVAIHHQREGEAPMPDAFHAVTRRAARGNEEAIAHVPLFRAAEADSFAVVFNSFAALESDFAEYYRTLDNGSPPNKVFLVGPSRAVAAAVTDGGERDPILQWLDGQAARSVVYACFGSTCGMGTSQLRELAAGLRASGRPFLWVIPSAAADAAVTTEKEERASSHGMVVAGRWAPQGDIVAHRAVGGFLTHCGWNSTLDAVAAGVPLATWPLRAEQFLNEAFLVDVARVGVSVREEVDGDTDEDAEAVVVTAEAVASAVGRLMGGDDDAAARRARAAELGVAARAAVADGGSSCGDWAELMSQLRALHRHDTEAPHARS